MRQRNPWAAFWLPILSVSLLLGSSVSAQSRRALLIGIDKYVPPVAGLLSAAPDRAAPPENRRDLITNLDGAINDAETIRDLLVARFEFPSDNVRLLRNAEATRAGILAAIQQLADASKAGDVVVFYYAGHGSQRRNSKSREASKLDQTIVPADANTGVFDIRDKELARAFNAVSDKGVTLTLIFDSCHSGSIVRGVPVVQKIRWAAYDPRDAADPDDPPRPEDHGALVIAAAQDYQVAAEMRDDDHVPHGVFTNALAKTLRTVPSDEPAVQVFQAVRAIMQSEGLVQEPVLAGTLARRKLPLFGGTPGAAGRTIVPVSRVKDSENVQLKGGLALGIRVGTELVLLHADSGARPVRLQVTALVGLSGSVAKVIEGRAIDLRPGAQFAIDRWVAPDGEVLRVWLPPATLNAKAVLEAATELSGLRRAEKVMWVDDPSAISVSGVPLFVLQFGNAGWELRPPKGPPVALGRTVSALRVAAAIRQHTDSTVRLFVLLPPSAELRKHLSLGAGTPNSAVELTPSMLGAQYLLVGHLAASGIEYAWVLPNVTPEVLQNSPLPARTDWVPSSATDSLAASQLEEFALGLAKIRGWLRLESPPDDGRFPYRLALKNVRTGVIASDTVPVHDKEGYGIVLRADPARINALRLEKRRVYVFAIDSHGKGVLLFPPADVLNRVPLEQPDGKYPAEIQLGDSLFTIGEPFGVDTYFLLTSDEAISTDALAWEGVRREGDRGGPKASPLSELLGATGSATRGLKLPVPAHWSVERLTLKSVP